MEKAWQWSWRWLVGPIAPAGKNREAAHCYSLLSHLFSAGLQPMDRTIRKAPSEVCPEANPTYRLPQPYKHAQGLVSSVIPEAIDNTNRHIYL